MKKKRKKYLSLILTLTLVLTTVIPVSAAENSSYIRGTFTFGPHNSEKDLTDSYIYSDGYFSDSAYNTNMHLAVMSMVMASASISSEEADYPEKSRNIQDLLGQLGFSEIEVNQYYKEKMQQNTMGTATAYKDLGDSVLLAIVPRSAGYESEWGGNFNVGDSGIHTGFQIGRDIVLGFAKDYVSNHTDAFKGKTVKVWTMGYSRGAAVANLIGGALVDDAGYLGVEVLPENIYDYTFGTPLTIPQNYQGKAEKYNNIHNYYADYDPVAMVPFSAWGFERYGQDIILDVYNESTKARMLEYLSKTNPNVYAAYTSNDAINDPDKFTAMTLGENLSIVPDTSKSVTQTEFLADRVAYLTKYVAPDRETYASQYQAALMAGMTFEFGSDDAVLEKFMSGAKDSSASKPLLVLLFFYDWVEQYVQQKGWNTPLETDWSEEVLPNPDESTGDETLDAFLGSEEYEQAFEGVTDSNLTEQYQVSTYGDLVNLYKSFGTQYMYQTLKDGLTAAGFSGEALEGHALLQGNVPEALGIFAANTLFGVDAPLTLDTVKEKIGKAATLLGNSSYMRVHNNEVILSWLRAMDTEAYEEPEKPSEEPEKPSEEPENPSEKPTKPSNTEKTPVSTKKTQAVDNKTKKNETVKQTEKAKISPKTGEDTKVYFVSEGFALLGMTGMILSTILPKKRKKAESQE